MRYKETVNFKTEIKNLEINNSYTILIVEDQVILSDLISQRLKYVDSDFEIIVAANAKDAIDAISKNNIILVILDLNLPDADNYSIVNKIYSNSPDLKIIVLSAEIEPTVVKKVLKTNVDGYVSKMSKPEDLVRAVKSVLNGQKYYSDDILDIIIHFNEDDHTNGTNNNSLLTKREKEILIHVSQELTSRQIAEKLHISKHTVETHKRRIMRKLEVNNTAGLIKVAIESNLI